MARVISLFRALLLVALVAAQLVAPAHGEPVSAIVVVATAAGILMSAVSGGCPLVAAADLCGCRTSLGIMHSYSKDAQFTGPRMTLDDDKTYFHWGAFCQVIPSDARNIFPGRSGGVQVGNGDWTYKTGVEVNVYYTVQDAAGKAVPNCWVKMYMDNPYYGSNEFNVALEGNGCPANLKTGMGRPVSGEMNSGREMFIYLDGVPLVGEASSIGPLALPPGVEVNVEELAAAESKLAALAEAPAASAGFAAAVFSAAAAAVVAGAALL